MGNARCTLADSEMVRLNERWLEYLKWQPETGMGYQIVHVELKDGRFFERVVVLGDQIHEVDGSTAIPFTEMDEIVAIKVQSGLSR